MEELASEIRSSRLQVKKEQGRILLKIDELIADATQARNAIVARVDDPRAVGGQLVACVRRGQDNFKKVVNLNKNYYDVLSR